MADGKLMTSKDLLSLKPLNKESQLFISKKASNLVDIRKNFKAAPSSVLSQVRDFLPKLASANADLQEKLNSDPTYSVDIEDLTDDEDAPHIEMSLALVEQNSESSESELDSSSEDDVEYGEVNENNIKLPRHKHASKQPLIQTVTPEDKCSSGDVTCEDQELIT